MDFELNYFPFNQELPENTNKEVTILNPPQAMHQEAMQQHPPRRRGHDLHGQHWTAEAVFTRPAVALHLDAPKLVQPTISPNDGLISLPPRYGLKHLKHELKPSGNLNLLEIASTLSNKQLLPL